MQWLLTGSALVILSGCVLCVVLAFRARNECDDIESSLRRALGRIAALEAEVDILGRQLHKLRGRLYGAKQESSANEIARPAYEGATCEKWLTAQAEGPRSAAASCECDYCTMKRAEREQLRARLVPKTNGERRNAIEKGKN